ncbi:MAG: CoA transferase [Rhodospirillum sp.]|nr:CoA transferase [Rhodospirillum sp.]
MSETILGGVRVLDFGRYIAAPLCAAMLADLGAEVIRVERPEGNDDRYLMPVAEDGEGAMFMQMNRNKRSLALDLTRPEFRGILDRLVRTADVVVANLPPKALAKAGLDYDRLRAIRSDIILTTVTAFGSSGAFANNIGFDGSGQALSGAVHLTGVPGHPYRSATSYVDYATGLSAAHGTLAAIIARMRTGKGQHVEASLLGTALAMTNPMLIEEATGARSRIAVGNRSPISGPSDLFATRDGWIFVQVVGNAVFERWASAVGAEDLRGDPRFASDIGRGDHGEALSERMRPWCASRTTEQCLEDLTAARVPVYRVLSPREALEADENGVFLQWTAVPGMPDPVPIVAPVARFSGYPETGFRPPPRLGADTEVILREIGIAPSLSGCASDGLAGDSPAPAGSL